MQLHSLGRSPATGASVRWRLCILVFRMLAPLRVVGLSRPNASQCALSGNLVSSRPNARATARRRVVSSECQRQCARRRVILSSECSRHCASSGCLVRIACARRVVDTPTNIERSRPCASSTVSQMFPRAWSGGVGACLANRSRRLCSALDCLGGGTPLSDCPIVPLCDVLSHGPLLSLPTLFSYSHDLYHSLLILPRAKGHTQYPRQSTSHTNLLVTRGSAPQPFG